MEYRIERDFLGEVKVPQEALYGIHAQRAKTNFPDEKRFSEAWFRALGTVKKACYLTIKSFRKAVEKKYPDTQFFLSMVSEGTLDLLITAAEEVSLGNHFNAFIVPAINGGAGTSINMNINEIIANRALQLGNHHTGEYHIIDPIVHANLYQSTNDVVPTALRLATMIELEKLEHSINGLRFAIEEKEKKYRDVIRVGYTQMQAAVPSSYGMLFGSYSDALSRDWWRVSKCFERIKVINLGGGATGTGMAIPRFFIMEVVDNLRHLTGFPLTRSDNMSDTTSNLDALVEVHAVIKALAVNLEKMSSDLRLLASDLTGGELSLPRQQLGSSIMPGKVNPVIPEFAISVAHHIYANDLIITSLSAQGCLELNPYIPIIGDALLNSVQLLSATCHSLKENLFEGLSVNSDQSLDHLYRNSSITTALIPFVGYHEASHLAAIMKNNKKTIFEANSDLQLLAPEKIQQILAPKELLKLGFSLKDL